MNFKILNIIGDNFAFDAKKILTGSFDVDYIDADRASLLDMISKYDGIIIGLGMFIDKEVIDRASKLKFIATATTGLDHIDVDYAERKDIKIISLKNDLEFMKRITGTAELAWGLILVLMRKIPSAFDSVKLHKWDREKFKGHSLSEKTLGILGLGRLGSIVARYGKAFGMDVLFCDPNIEYSDYAKKVSLDELLALSDVISIHVHLNSSTENLISKDALTKMKKDAVIVNTSRGKIVDEDSMLEALKTRMVGGYATDVLSGEIDWEENIPDNHPLVNYAKEDSNLIIVPHIGGMTEESRILTDIRIAEKIISYTIKLS